MAGWTDMTPVWMMAAEWPRRLWADRQRDPAGPCLEPRCQMNCQKKNGSLKTSL
jgi:hypothetical protein